MFFWDRFRCSFDPSVVRSPGLFFVFCWSSMRFTHRACFPRSLAFHAYCLLKDVLLWLSIVSPSPRPRPAPHPESRRVSWPGLCPALIPHSSRRRCRPCLHIRSISWRPPASRKYLELPSCPSWALLGDGVYSCQLEFSVNLAFPISPSLTIHFADPISCSCLPCHNASPRIQGFLFHPLFYHSCPVLSLTHSRHSTNRDVTEECLVSPFLSLSLEISCSAGAAFWVKVVPEDCLIQ